MLLLLKTFLKSAKQQQHEKYYQILLKYCFDKTSVWKNLVNIWQKIKNKASVW